MTEKWRTCKNVEKLGQTAVFVTTNCPRALMIAGRMVSTRDRCTKCEKYEGRTEENERRESNKNFSLDQK